MRVVPTFALAAAIALFPWKVAAIAASEAQECAEEAPACADEECDEVQEVSLLQRRQTVAPPRKTVAAAAAAANGEPCNPCEIREVLDGKGKLDIDIYTPASDTDAPRPVVLAFHGNGGTVKQMTKQCRTVFAKAGFACVPVDPLNNLDEPTFFTEHAISYLVANAGKYNLDVDNMFLYGYSKGGHSDLYYEMWSEDDSTRQRVKGMISDCSSPGDKRFDWAAKDSNNKYKRYPPYLMLHCNADPVMETSWSIKTSVKHIDKANKERPSDEQIIYHTLRFSPDTGCTHKSLLLHTEAGRDAAVNFIKNVVAGKDPFDGIPTKIEGADSFH